MKNKKTIFCFFDIFDVCIAFKYQKGGPILSNPGNYHPDKIIDKGLYEIPNDICPLDRSAEELYKYSKKIKIRNQYYERDQLS